MVKKRTKKTSYKKRSSIKKPVGFVKDGSNYRIAFGSKSKPVLGSSRFRTKASMMKKVKSLLKK